jgi:hypothetical protein
MFGSGSRISTRRLTTAPAPRRIRPVLLRVRAVDAVGEAGEGRLRMVRVVAAVHGVFVEALTAVNAEPVRRPATLGVPGGGAAGAAVRPSFRLCAVVAGILANLSFACRPVTTITETPCA